MDRTLLLTNAVLGLRITLRNCTLGNLKKVLNSRLPDLVAKLTELDRTIKPIADARHLFAHRGQSRVIAMFSAIGYAKAAAQALGAPVEGVHFNDEQALKELLQTMHQDIDMIEREVGPVLDTLHKPYLEHLQELGGVTIPSEAEMTRASAFLKHVGGGQQQDVR